MSIPVEIERLSEALAERGPGYLLTTSAEGRVKAVTVEPRLQAGILRCPPSGGSARNLAATPVATLLFPPVEPRGHTLLIDGRAVAGDDGIAFTPEHAVLHRPADYADPDDRTATEGCGHDCTPLT